VDFTVEILAGGPLSAKRRNDLNKPNILLFSTVLSVLTAGSVAALAEADIITKTSQWTKPFSIDINVTGGKTVRLDYRQGRFVVTDKAGDKALLMDGLDMLDVLHGQVIVSIADMNFDGYKDIAIDESQGYGGVNIFTAVYFWDPGNGRYKTKGFKVSNFDLDDKAKVLSSAQRSGPFWYRTDYKFENGVPWAYEEIIGPGVVEIHKYFDKSGKVIRKILADPNRQGTAVVPAIFSVPVAKIYFYSKPDENSKTSTYIVKGDKVEVLDEAGSWSQWLKVRYRGKKTFVRWIKAGEIDQEQ
jgi:hypothetical protein